MPAYPHRPDPCDACAQCFAPTASRICPRTGTLVRLPDREWVPAPKPANDNEAHNALGAVFASHMLGL